MSNDDFEPEDQLAILRAGIDQMIATAPEMARACKGMFLAFTEEGFTEAQSLYLVAVQIKDSPGPPP